MENLAIKKFVLIVFAIMFVSFTSFPETISNSMKPGALNDLKEKITKAATEEEQRWNDIIKLLNDNKEPGILKPYVDHLRSFVNTQTGIKELKFE
ncbi:MAG: hypothetical protein MUF15_22765 [Acidobacteria bacterium]|nr:hypothetical protein [Acidobacteriota bacterium]